VTSSPQSEPLSVNQAPFLTLIVPPSCSCLIAENRYIKVGDLGKLGPSLTLRRSSHGSNLWLFLLLGLAKALGKEGKGYNKAGTPGYIAPEVNYNQGKGKTPGYRYPADIWSIGIILWELCDGMPPRWAPISWYWTSLHFPQSFSPALRLLLQGMLQKSPKERITLPAIKAHEWFQGFDWEALATQKMEAPMPPEYEYMHIHSNLAQKVEVEAVM